MLEIMQKKWLTEGVSGKEHRHVTSVTLGQGQAAPAGTEALCGEDHGQLVLGTRRSGMITAGVRGRGEAGPRGRKREGLAKGGKRTWGHKGLLPLQMQMAQLVCDLKVKTGERGIKDTARKRVLVGQESTGRVQGCGRGRPRASAGRRQDGDSGHI